MKRTASAVWTGGLKDGLGQLTTQSTVLINTPYGFKTRFEEEPGTNPEELIAAAHAGCFSMALAAQLGESGLTPERIETSAEVTLQKFGDGFSITTVHLNLVARIPGADAATFTTLANKAKTDCPVSKLLNATITLDAKLET
jgi:osmotically inducible protein OsmC